MSERSRHQIRNQNITEESLDSQTFHNILNSVPRAKQWPKLCEEWALPGQLVRLGLQHVPGWLKIDLDV